MAPTHEDPRGQGTHSHSRGFVDDAFKASLFRLQAPSPVVSQGEELTLHSLMTFVLTPTLWTWTYTRVSRRSAPAGTIAVVTALEVSCVTVFLRNS